jgi:hypothetical protein
MSMTFLSHLVRNLLGNSVMTFLDSLVMTFLSPLVTTLFYASVGTFLDFDLQVCQLILLLKFRMFDSVRFAFQ